MESIDTFKTRFEIKILGKKYVYFDLNLLAKYFNFELSSVPNSIKVLLENLIRNEDGESITAQMINSVCSQLGIKNQSFENANGLI